MQLLAGNCFMKIDFVNHQEVKILMMIRTTYGN